MAVIFIESDNTKSIKLLTVLAVQLGVSVNKLSKPQAENLHLNLAAKNYNRSTETRLVLEKVTSANENAENTFLKLRKRIKTKMTNEQIDKQIKSLRQEWQRDN